MGIVVECVAFFPNGVLTVFQHGCLLSTIDKIEVYNYGWLRFSNDSRARTYRLQHGKDYAIVWSRRSNGWTVVEVP